MNLKLRFALLFTFCVAVILVSSSGTIYILNSNFREEDYFERAKAEGLDLYNKLNTAPDPQKHPGELFLKGIHHPRLYDERVMIIDGSGKLIFKLPDTLHANVDPYILQNIKANNEYRWYSENQYQNVGTYVVSEERIVISTGFDRNGFAKLRKLKIILSVVLVAGLLLTALISFLFVRAAFRPLTKLSEQLNNTSLEDLTQRLEVKNTKDEISEIAENFNAMLVRLDKAYGFQKSFVYHASHELRTPLATMLSETESALDRKMTDKGYEKLLLSLKEEQQELIELTNSLLLLSQYEEMGFAQEWPHLRIDEILYDAISQAARLFPVLIPDISFNPLPEIDNDLIVQGNESLLKSAFFNLLKNAFLYSTDQKVMISIESKGQYVLIHIENGGPQPEPEEVEKLMVPFYRGHNALKSKGFGLGLSIIHRIITIHKGKIAYQALSGSINRFTVTLLKSIADKNEGA